MTVIVNLEGVDYTGGMSRIFRRIATRWIRNDDAENKRKWYRSEHGDLILVGDNGSGEPLRFETEEPADFRAAWNSFSPDEA